MVILTLHAVPRLRQGYVCHGWTGKTAIKVTLGQYFKSKWSLRKRCVKHKLLMTMFTKVCIATESNKNIWHRVWWVSQNTAFKITVCQIIPPSLLLTGEYNIVCSRASSVILKTTSLILSAIRGSCMSAKKKHTYFVCSASINMSPDTSNN